MSGPLQADSIRIGSSAVSDAPAGFSVGNSMMLNDGDSQYLNRTFGTPSSASQFGYSFWVKLGGGYAGGYIISADGSGNNDNLYFESTGKITIQEGGAARLTTTQVLRDFHAWYNVIVAYDLGNGTNSLKLRLYINGLEVTDFDTDTRSSLSGTSSRLNANGISHDIGANVNNGVSTHVNPFDGYLAEFVFLDGTVITPSDVGEFDSNKVWRPISIEDASLTFGNNGFYLQFATAAGLGQDSSGSSSLTVVQKNTYNAGSEINDGDSSANPSTGMLFTAPVSGTISKIELNASSRGFSGVTVRLETDGGSGTAPSGTIVTNGEVTGITSSGAGLKTATFSTPPEVVAGTKYWIVLRGDTGTWGWQHDVSGVGPALGLYQGSLGYYSGRGVGHYVYMVGNHFTAANSPTQTTDSPTTNYAVMTPLYPDSGTASNGNLTIATAGNDGDQPIGSIAFDSSDSDGYYFVIRPTTTSSTIGAFAVGVATVDHANDKPRNDLANAGSWFLSCGNGNVTNTSTIANATWDSQSNGGGSLNDYFQIAVKAGKIYFGKNNTWYDSSDGSFANAGEAFSNLTGFIIPMFQHAHASAGTVQVEFGALGYTHAKPTNMKDINAANLFASNTPAIGDGTAYHQTSIWQGNTTARKITQDGNSKFKPDFLWGKNRDNGGYSFRLFDAVRGNSKLLQLGGTSGLDPESTDTNGQTDFEVDGFDIGNGVHLNDSGDAIVGWQWLGANGTATPSGSSYISNLTVSANTTSGFSVGTFTAGSSGNNGVVAHGLGGQADWIVVKPLNSSAEGNVWVVWHSGINSTTGNTTRSFLNDDAINGSGAARINAAGTTTFTINDDAFFHGRNHSFLAWRAIPGFSAFGSYVGNGSASDGPFIELGFSASWVLFKRVSGSDASWAIYDNKRDQFNPAQRMLLADSAAGDNVGNKIDFLANGVKIKGNSGAYNGSGNTYIFSAFAINPFAGSTPATAR